MLKNIPIPASFSRITKGTVSLLLKDKYRDLLLQEGIEDIDAFLRRNHPGSKHLEGRTLHPCVPLKNGEWMVVRRYSHGGLLRSLTRDLYLVGSRSFLEAALTEEIRSHGIPTIEPIGAIHHRVFGFFYRAYLLSLEIPSARNLVQYLREMPAHLSGERLAAKRRIIRSGGLILRQFHQAGFFHADLQLKNLVLSGGQLFLIDFDRSCRKEILSLREKTKNLLRLDRSAEKWKRKGLAITRGDRMRFFLAYAGDDLEIRKTLRKALRTYAFRSVFHRWYWALRKFMCRDIS